MDKVERINENGDKETFYICHNNRKLEFIRKETKIQDGFSRTFKIRRFPSKICFHYLFPLWELLLAQVILHPSFFPLYN